MNKLRETTEAESHLNGGNQQAMPAARIGEDNRCGSLCSKPEAEWMGEVGENTEEDAAKMVMCSAEAFIEGGAGTTKGERSMVRAPEWSDVRRSGAWMGRSHGSAREGETRWQGELARGGRSTMLLPCSLTGGARAHLSVSERERVGWAATGGPLARS